VQRGGELLPLPGVGDERAADGDHEVGGTPVAEHLALPRVVAAGDHVEELGEVGAADRKAHRRHPGRQPVAAPQQDLAGRPEIDHRAQPERGQPREVRVGEAAQRVAPEELSADHVEVAQAAVAADVAHVDRPVERHPAAGQAAHRVIPEVRTVHPPFTVLCAPSHRPPVPM